MNQAGSYKNNPQYSNTSSIVREKNTIMTIDKKMITIAKHRKKENVTVGENIQQ